MILSLKYKTLMSKQQLDLRLTYQIFDLLCGITRPKTHRCGLAYNTRECFREKVLVRDLIRF